MTYKVVASSRQHALQESKRQPTPEGTSNPTLESPTLNESSHVGSDDTMESTTQTGSKRLKSDSKRVDFISMLPDDILHHILSFLPTKQAVATSVISKRWRLLCTSVDILLSQGNNISYLSSVKDVNTTILARDVHPSTHPPIRKFRLRYWMHDDFHSYADNVNAWINALIRQRIENLDMELIFTLSLSCNIFRCKTLVVLKLTRISLRDCSSVELPSLKCLHLSGVHFQQPQNLMVFLYGLPNLEALVAHRIYCTHNDESFCKEEFKSLPKLVRADVLSDKGYLDVPLKAISNVESLSISQQGLDKGIPEFPNLIHLVFSFVNNWNSVLEMLKNCPKLQVFELVFRRRYGDDDGPLPNPHFVPQCLTSHLTKCILEHCTGTKDQLQFAKFIMQRSTTLQTMTIRSVHSLWPDLTCKFFEELASCPKISPLCKLISE